MVVGNSVNANYDMQGIVNFRAIFSYLVDCVHRPSLNFPVVNVVYNVVAGAVAMDFFFINGDFNFSYLLNLIYPVTDVNLVGNVDCNGLFRGVLVKQVSSVAYSGVSIAIVITKD